MTIGTRVEVINLPIAEDRCTSCSVDFRERNVGADLALRIGNAKLRLCVKCAIALWKELVPHIFSNVEIEDSESDVELLTSLVEDI